MSFTWTQTQTRRLTELDASESDLKKQFDDSSKRERGYQKMEKQLVARQRRLLKEFRDIHRKPGLCRLESRKIGTVGDNRYVCLWAVSKNFCFSYIALEGESRSGSDVKESEFLRFSLALIIFVTSKLAENLKAIRIIITVMSGFRTAESSGVMSEDGSVVIKIPYGK